MSCHCGRALDYSQCCEPLHLKVKTANTAEDLMRSRFSAFVVGNVDYLLETHDKETQTDDLRSGIIETLSQCRFTQLNVLDSSDGKEQHSTGRVSFIAWYIDKESDELLQLAENSSFSKDKSGKWLYVDGISINPAKPGRNDNCPCSSGKKFKRCCS